MPDIGYTLTFDWKIFLKSLIEGAMEKLDERLNYSFKEYHSPLVSYINLLKTDQLTVKVYRIKGEKNPLVNPHSHAYSFHTVCLAGFAKNLRFKESKQHGAAYTKYLWDAVHKTPLFGEKTRLINYQTDHLSAGCSYYLGADEIHTLEVPVDSWLLLLEYTSSSPSYLLLPEEHNFGAGTYSKFTKSEFKDLIKELEGIL